VADAFTVKFDTTGAFAALDALEAKARAAVRPAAQAGAQVLYDEVLQRVPTAGTAHVLKSGRVIQPGALKGAIYQVYSKGNSNELNGLATYHVSYNAKKAPHGSLVEFGHVMTRAAYQGKDGRWYTTRTPLAAPRRVGARPYLRPAFDAVITRALQASKDRWVAAMKSSQPSLTTAPTGADA
jgi:hypothetical protein